MINGKIIYDVQDVVGVHPDSVADIHNNIVYWRKLYLDPEISTELRKQAFNAAQKLEAIRERWVSTGQINRTDEPNPLPRS